MTLQLPGQPYVSPQSGEPITLTDDVALGIQTSLQGIQTLANVESMRRDFEFKREHADLLRDKFAYEKMRDYRQDQAELQQQQIENEYLHQANERAKIAHAQSLEQFKRQARIDRMTLKKQKRDQDAALEFEEEREQSLDRIDDELHEIQYGIPKSKVAQGPAGEFQKRQILLTQDKGEEAATKRADDLERMKIRYEHLAQSKDPEMRAAYQRILEQYVTAASHPDAKGRQPLATSLERSVRASENSKWTRIATAMRSNDDFHQAFEDDPDFMADMTPQQIDYVMEQIRLGAIDAHPFMKLPEAAQDELKSRRDKLLTNDQYTDYKKAKVGFAEIKALAENSVNNPEGVEYQGTGYVPIPEDVGKPNPRLMVDPKAPSAAANDIAMVFKFMKILDPGSVVRESEFRAAIQIVGFAEEFFRKGRKLTKGELLTPEMRTAIVNTARNSFNEKANEAKVEVDLAVAGLDGFLQGKQKEVGEKYLRGGVEFDEVESAGTQVQEQKDLIPSYDESGNLIK